MPAIAIILAGLSFFVVVRMRLRDPVPTEAQGPFVAFPKNITGVATGLNPEAEWTDIVEDDVANDPFKDNPYVN